MTPYQSFIADLLARATIQFQGMTVTWADARIYLNEMESRPCEDLPYFEAAKTILRAFVNS